MNVSGSIVEIFNKPILLTMFVEPEYYIYGTGPSLEVSVPHYDFFNNALGVFLGGNIWQIYVSDQLVFTSYVGSYYY